MTNRKEKVETVRDFILGGSKITADGDCSYEIKMLTPWKKSYDKPRHHIEKQRHHFTDKGPYSQSYGFSSSHVQMWEMEIKKAEHQRIDAFKLCWMKNHLESPLDCKEINPVNPERNQPLIWIFIGRTDAEVENPVLWPPDAKNWLTGKDPDAGKDWKQEKKEATEDEMVGWHHWLKRHAFDQTLGIGDGLGALVHGVAKSWTLLSNWTELRNNHVLRWSKTVSPDFCNLKLN